MTHARQCSGVALVCAFTASNTATCRDRMHATNAAKLTTQRRIYASIARPRTRSANRTRAPSVKKVCNVLLGFGVPYIIIRRRYRFWVCLKRHHSLNAQNDFKLQPKLICLLEFFCLSMFASLSHCAIKAVVFKSLDNFSFLHVF